MRSAPTLRQTTPATTHSEAGLFKLDKMLARVCVKRFTALLLLPTDLAGDRPGQPETTLQNGNAWFNGITQGNSIGSLYIFSFFLTKLTRMTCYNRTPYMPS